MEPAAFVAITLVSAILGLALGVVIGRYAWPAAPAVDPAAFALAQSEAAGHQHECALLRSRVEELNQQCAASGERARAAGEELARVGERVVGLTKQIEEQTELVRRLEEQRERAAADGRVATQQIAALTEREKALTEKLAAQATQLANLQKQLTAEFETIATRILKTNASELSELSQKNLSAVLDPLRERIQEFQRKVEATYEAETREVLSLKEQIRTVVETSNAIGSQADGLAKALRGDSQVLGRWGELALERILEAAGLTEGREYVSQGRGLGLKDQEGGTQKPDVLVMLPEERTIVIDSKVSLASYERLIAAQDAASRQQARNDFVRDMKVHIDGLSRKRYQENDRLQAHDAVLMFVPIEGALAAALTCDPELFTYAWHKSVVLVGPPTLLMTMRTVASIWRYEHQAQHSQEIARLAGELCDKVSLSLADFHGVTEKLNAAAAAQNEAIKRFATGKGNALAIGDRIRQLGVKTRRPRPNVLVDGIPAPANASDLETDELIETQIAAE